MEENVRRANKTVENLYEKRPELRPTAAAKEAACRQKIVKAFKR